MRPDERANEAIIERDEKMRGNVASGIKSAVALGTGAAATGVAARVLPWLSHHIPTDLAMKGLSKVSPKVASFLERGKSMGLDVEQGIDYLRDQISPKEEEGKAEPAKTDKNIVQQYSLELDEFIKNAAGQGINPIKAALNAEHVQGFNQVIKKIVKDHKVPWSQIVESIYGKEAVVNPSSQQAAPQPQQQQAQANQTQGGQGQQALMAILAKINQKLGQ